MQITCVITGCALIDLNKTPTLWVPGDLFDAGPLWVFNGNFSEDMPGSPWLDPDVYPRHYIKCITLVGDYFMRRGVFVIPKSSGVLNDEAIRYINGG